MARRGLQIVLVNQLFIHMLGPAFSSEEAGFYFIGRGCSPGLL